MASLAATAYRVSARMVRRRIAHDVAARGFRTSSAALAAQNFTMPALSPTMTEGNIATWRVKEGEKFAAGDVLLEIETDKATMDVEAQEDGVVMKIMQPDGTKGVAVGQRIAVLAEPDDDLSALEIPPDEPSSSAKPAEEAKEAPKAESRPAPPQSEAAAPSAQAAPAAPAAAEAGGKPYPKQTYPLLPSVAHLIKEHGIDESKISEMKPTGPNGRLLKGDVLAYLGSVKPDVPQGIEDLFEKLSHLDLSNIKVAKAPEPKKEEAAAASAAAAAAEKAAPPPVEEDLLVALPVSLAAVAEVQGRIQSSLGVFMPLSTFVARAAELANDALPLPAGAQPSADELFDSILGLPSTGTRKASRGAYVPQISALQQQQSLLAAAASRSTRKEPDIIDILTGKAKKPAAAVAAPSLVVAGATSADTNVFSLTVPKREARRAKVFLDRMKLVLETEPGRLVL